MGKISQSCVDLQFDVCYTFQHKRFFYKETEGYKYNA
jgi:hypothetical protein